jgi:hypothetical protein
VQLHTILALDQAIANKQLSQHGTQQPAAVQQATCGLKQGDALSTDWVIEWLVACAVLCCPCRMPLPSGHLLLTASSLWALTTMR